MTSRSVVPKGKWVGEGGNSGRQANEEVELGAGRCEVQSGTSTMEGAVV